MIYRPFWMPDTQKKSEVETGPIDANDPRRNCRFCKGEAAVQARAGAKDGSGSIISIVVCSSDKCLKKAKNEIEDDLRRQQERPLKPNPKSPYERKKKKEAAQRKMTLLERLAQAKQRK